MADREALWQALVGGTLQVVATDHCPWNDADREHGRARFDRIPGGLPGVETRLALLYGLGVAADRLSLTRLAALCSAEPARLFGLYPRKGTFDIGADADLAILDSAGRTALRAASLHQRVDNCPYEGWELPGRLVATVAGGRIIVREGEFVGKVGAGRLLARGRSSLCGGQGTGDTDNADQDEGHEATDGTD